MKLVVFDEKLYGALISLRRGSQQARPPQHKGGLRWRNNPVGVGL